MAKKPYTPAYPAELRERGVWLFRETRVKYPSDSDASKAIAPKLGCSPDSLRIGLTRQEKDRIKDLKREVKELRQANAILKKARAYFASVEQGRPLRK